MKFYTVILILMIFGCHHSPEELPILSYKINDRGDQVPYTINYTNFKNQDNQAFTTENIMSKIVVANFFFTRCPSICPPMRTELQNINEVFKNKNDFLMVSHTIDPKNDTVEVLYNYAKSTGVDSDRWQFIRSTTEETKKQAELYMTNFRPTDDETDFYHSSYVALLDRKQRIRGFYNILAVEESERLIEDLKQLLE